MSAILTWPHDTRVVAAVFTSSRCSLTSFFRDRYLAPETPNEFIHRLSQHLEQSELQDLSSSAKQTLIRHRFVDGLPQDLRRNFDATLPLQQLVEKARLAIQSSRTPASEVTGASAMSKSYYKCGGQGHFARHCTQQWGNWRGLFQSASEQPTSVESRPTSQRSTA